MDNDKLYDLELWQAIENDGKLFEQSLDKLTRKQTGSYYTSLELTCFMMQEMVNSLKPEERKSLYKKKFLEPCVGTGNFVFAYLKVCRSLGFSDSQNAQLINNIYVCDIISGALELYKKNLKKIAWQWFGIVLDDNYFETHIGGGLLFDVTSKEIEYIPISNVFDANVLKNGFDIIATNPPYKNLKAEISHYSTEKQRDTDKLKYYCIGQFAEKYFPYSTRGTLNIYKLFVEEILERYLSSNGIASLLIPSSILSDKSCSKIRTHILEAASIKSLRIIPENSSYVDASQALCAILLHKGDTSDDIYVDNSFDGKVGQEIKVNFKDIVDKDAENSILVLKDTEYYIRNKMKQHPTIKEIAYIHNLRGELDVTIDKNFVTKSQTPYTLLRGKNISHYEIMLSLEQEYVNSSFIEATAKREYVFAPRLACQQVANMAKKRRVSFTLVPENVVLANSCNFISVDNNTDEVDIYFLLGILNSTLIDWFFKLTSSNNHVNNYEIDNFPIPLSYSKKKLLSDVVQNYLELNDAKLLSQIDELVYDAYGIVNLNKAKNYSYDAIKLESDNIYQAFYNDVMHLVPGIKFDECCSILDGRANSKEIAFQRKPNMGIFEHKVLENIENKYRKLYNGEILNHTTFKLSDLDLEMIKSVPQGGSWKDIPQVTVKKSKRLERINTTGGRTTLYGRIDYSMPSYTITTYFNRPGNGTYVHPIHQRVISVREAARFQSFPDNYFFYGNKTDMLNQVGNAVPVLLAYNIGKMIKEKTGCHTSVDLFSGAGGMTYGFKQAGISAVIANDFSESACVTLKTNSPEIPIYCGDITNEETKQTIIVAGIKANADIICGGPPCQGFSLAGYRMKDDPRNELFSHFVDIVSAINPKVIVFENVEGLLSYNNGETYRNIIELFSNLGYNTEGRKLLANYYGVPQRRKRVIILCTRKDIGVLPEDLFPLPITFSEDCQTTAYETIYDLENVECSETAKYNSSYTSLFTKYLKSEISIDEYLDSVKEPRKANDTSLMIKRNANKSRTNRQITQYQQLTFFDAIKENQSSL